MGMIGTLVKLGRGIMGIKGNAPGKSAVMQAEGVEGQTMSTEVYQAPGIMAIPGDGTRGVWLPIGGSSRYGVVIATQNYALNIEINAGETAIYSSTPDGKTVKALLKLKADGTVEMNGNTKRLVTWDELNTALQAMVGIINSHTHQGSAVGIGIPFTTATPLPATTLDISTAKTTTLKTGG